MKFRAFFLLLGLCFPHWTTSSIVRAGNYLLDIDERTLKNVTILVNFSDIDVSGLQIKDIAKNDFNNLAYIKTSKVSNNILDIRPEPISLKSINLENLTLASVNSSHIDLSALQIKHIANNAFDNLAHIETLNLSNNALESLPPLIFSKMFNLKELTLAHNKISSFLYAFIGLTNLKLLNLSNNHIRFFSLTHLHGLKKSTEIIIEGNPLRSLHIEIPLRNSSFLEDESFDQPIIDEVDEEPIPENFRVKLCKTDNGTVESLEELKQNETLGDCMEASVFDYEGLIRLDDLGLKEFKRGWFKLSSDFIRAIDLSRNQIADITPELLNDLPLPLLVDLTDNEIRVIKKNIIENKHCLKLNLGGNSPLVIEDGAFERLCLTQLGVDKTGLNNLSFIRTLPDTLELLVLTRNGISEIPSNTFRGLKKLREIHLSFNNLENIGLGTFIDQKNLSVISLTGNRISQLNFELFKDSPVLRTINLDFNRIKKITENTSFGLRHLQRFDLDLSDNEIDSIGDGSFSNLSMSMLDLSRNKITDESIVKGAFNMCTVDNIYLRRNFIRNLDGESFSGILETYSLSLHETPIKNIKNFSN